MKLKSHFVQRALCTALTPFVVSLGLIGCGGPEPDPIAEAQAAVTAASEAAGGEAEQVDAALVIPWLLVMWIGEAIVGLAVLAPRVAPVLRMAGNTIAAAANGVRSGTIAASQAISSIRGAIAELTAALPRISDPQVRQSVNDLINSLNNWF